MSPKLNAFWRLLQSRFSRHFPLCFLRRLPYIRYHKIYDDAQNFIKKSDRFSQKQTVINTLDINKI
ncbi:hypothetical protein DCC62_17485 [candidate division KSB1 bacterium]|nr:MAG: hypothetical protein DCC62_17485 [candidate division KSB1 bacterium]